MILKFVTCLFEKFILINPPKLNQMLKSKTTKIGCVEINPEFKFGAKILMGWT
jgi:hypothetical protein